MGIEQMSRWGSASCSADPFFATAELMIELTINSAGCKRDCLSNLANAFDGWASAR